jgi:hypothetical protein
MEAVGEQQWDGYEPNAGWFGCFHGGLAAAQADAFGLPTGASAKMSTAGMPGAIWCSTAFI